MNLAQEFSQVTDLKILEAEIESPKNQTAEQQFKLMSRCKQLLDKNIDDQIYYHKQAKEAIEELMKLEKMRPQRSK